MKSLLVLKSKNLYLSCFILFLTTYCFLSLSFTKLKVLLVVLFGIVSILTAGYSLARNVKIRYTFNLNIFIFIMIYLFWLLLSVFYGNDPAYIFQDSVGFPLYLSYFPLAFILIKFGSVVFYERFLITIGIAVSFLHMVAYLLISLFLGVGTQLTKTHLDYVNEMLMVQGLTAAFGASHGMIRVDFWLGPLLLIPLVLLLRDVMKAKSLFSSKARMAVLVILIVGIVLEGHKSLLVTAVIEFVLFYFMSVKYSKHLFTDHLRIMKFLIIIIPVMVISFGALRLFDIYDLEVLGNRMKELVSVEEGITIDEARLNQIPSLVEKISENPLLGSGFGSHAKVVRNEERPFMYEVDYLAVFMKLGVLGSILYFGAYIAVLISGFKKMKYCFDQMSPFVAAGAAYLFYMGTNGGFAMSQLSTLFHITIMLGIAVAMHAFNKKCRYLNLSLKHRRNGRG